MATVTIDLKDILGAGFADCPVAFQPLQTPFVDGEGALIPTAVRKVVTDSEGLASTELKPGKYLVTFSGRAADKIYINVPDNDETYPLMTLVTFGTNNLPEPPDWAGPAGDAATITISTVTTVDPDEPATVSNIGTASDAILVFSIPRGQTGAPSADARRLVTPDGDNKIFWNGTAWESEERIVAESFEGDGSQLDGLTKSQVGLGNVPNVNATIRSNHTGTQTASTISDFDEAALASVQDALDLKLDINGDGSQLTNVQAKSLLDGANAVAWSAGLSAWNTSQGIRASHFAGDGSAVTALNASNLASGTVPQARMPAPVSGTITGTEIPLSGSGVYNYEATDDVAFTFPGSPVPGSVVIIAVDNSDEYEITWPAGITWQDGLGPDLVFPDGRLVEFIVLPGGDIRGAWL